ncbi:MarR family winged helix-turn-helix transcriptional regulator [Streptomyces coffeae]|uniref:MarR family transcriptional regulator n=1 Tax=Streptomyces coffeae TaxID=621382 RepID=A0ABS1N5E0_9ACTN|nr:MarR family transcriptional regulator [Streptomyces coffeae]MBL1095300.1 MarR family transcriptional regulator [Streptomyces coffeae]
MPTSSPLPVPESDVEAMVNALLVASRLLVAVSARSLAAVEETLTLPQFRMLVVLENSGQLSLSRLAEELGVQPSTAMRMIDRLVAAGMVARGASEVDRRASVIALTETGRRTVEEVTQRRKGELTGIVEAMSVGQRRGLIEALRAFTEAGGEPSGGHAGERGARRRVAGW